MPDETLPPDRSKVGVVLVAFRSGPDVLVRARELLEGGFVVRVVDNSGEYADDSVIDPGRNLGFGAACNIGVAELPVWVSTVVFHNPDVRCALSEIDQLVLELRRSAHPGVVAAAERHPDGYVRYGYQYPTLRREVVLSAVAVMERRGIGGPMRFLRRRSGRQHHRRVGADPSDVFGSGALMAVDRQQFERVAGFDPAYFLYVEDLDLWERIRRDGGDAFVSSLAVDHRVGTGSDASRHRRELLRWLGVEQFLENAPTGGHWRLTRCVHRLALTLGGGPSDGIERAVSTHWKVGERPSEVMGLLRSDLERRSTTPLIEAGDVGVVITCHDYGRFLEEAVETVMAQSHRPASVVIFDDASSDETPAVMAALQLAHPAVATITSSHRLGVVAARNLGLAALRTTYVCCVDADDTLPPEYFAELLGPLRVREADIAFAPLRPFGPRASSVRTAEGYDWDRQLTDNLINASALFRRELLTVSGGFTPVLDRLGYEDWEFWTRLVADGARVAFVSSTGLGYRRHGETTRNPTAGPRRLVARFVVWWRLRAVVRPRHLWAWMGPILARWRRGERGRR